MSDTPKVRDVGADEKALRTLLGMLREHGVSAFEGYGMKVVLGPAIPAAAGDAPKTGKKREEESSDPEDKLDGKLFGPLGIRKRGKK